jgi:hypothetical protein
VKDAPSIGTDGELPAAEEEAIFKHYGLTYQPGASVERRLARRSTEDRMIVFPAPADRGDRRFLSPDLAVSLAGGRAGWRGLDWPRPALVAPVTA